MSSLACCCSLINWWINFQSAGEEVHLHQSNIMLILWENQSLDIFNLLFDHNFEGHCLASYKRWIKSFNILMFLMLCFDNKWRRVTVLFWVGGQGRTSPIHAPNLPSQPFHKYIIMRLCKIFDSSVIGQTTKGQTNRPTRKQNFFSAFLSIIYWRRIYGMIGWSLWVLLLFYHATKSFCKGKFTFVDIWNQ